jgi:DNA repair protein RadC
MTEEAKADRECFWVLHLNVKNKLIEKELISIGTVSSSLVHPREVFKKAILNGASSMITIHNHPSDDTTPSKDDRVIWKRLDETGKIVGIQVLDHLIISPSGAYFSGKEGIIKNRKEN